MKMKNGWMRNIPGFTVLEIMITVAVFAILIVVAVPNMALLSNAYQLRGAAREVASDLQFARLLAVKENRSIRVAFASNSYQILRVSDGSVVKSRNVANDYPGLTLTNLSVDFYSRGDSNGNTIIVTNPRGAKNITVNYTGRILIQ